MCEANKSGQTLVKIGKDLKLFYVNQLGPNRHTRDDPVHGRDYPKSPISQAILDLIKEKRRLMWLYNNTQDANTKSAINKLQKEIMTKINQESSISWEKFCNSISLESDPKKIMA